MNPPPIWIFSPPINTLHVSSPSSSLFSLATKVEHLVYNYSTPSRLLLFLSSPLLPFFLPTLSPHLYPPSNTPQINMALIREGGDAGHIAHSTLRKGKVVCHCSLPVFLSLSISTSCTSAFPLTQFLPQHRQPSHSSNCFHPFSFFSHFSVSIFRDGGDCFFLPQAEWFLSPSVVLFQQSNFSSFAQHV